MLGELETTNQHCCSLALSLLDCVCRMYLPPFLLRLSWNRAGSFVTPQTKAEARDGNQNKLLVSTSRWSVASFQAAVDGAVIRRAL